ncbi:MAG: 30S ribosomal protein S12 methylthiotransferase RimO [Phycisphaerales bacterium]|nr:30S ribosomal protein S12 methylthiotransferase RimO [Phycisphaerales bacterium]
MTASTESIQRVAFVSLGCPKNLVDSEKMLGLLKRDGLTLVNEDNDPDAIVVNTCGFLEASKVESLSVITDAIERKRKGELKRVVVAGCLVQRHRAKILEWAPGIDALIGVFDRDHILDAVRGVRGQRDTLDSAGGRPGYWIASNALAAAAERGVNTVGLTVNGKDGLGIGYFEGDDDRVRLTPRHWAYLRVSEGCNQRCSFCTIPSIRGKMRSKPLPAITAETKQLLADGVYELNLIGQDTTSWGMDIGDTSGLVGLLEGIDRAVQDHGGGWVRLMYAYPSNFTTDMIDAIARLPSLVKYIDIPLQHASDAMLTSMRRHVSAATQEALVERLRERIPGMAIRTTLITGHPGETEKDHQELMAFVERMQFDALGVFKYSPESGTPSGTMHSDPALCVSAETAARREGEIMELQQSIAFGNASFVAQQRSQFDVLIDSVADGKARGRATSGVAATGTTLHVGRAYHQAPQIDSVTHVVSRERLASGEIVRCTIVESDGYDLVAQPVVDLDATVRLPVIRR